jgi:hypothetical protein
MLRIVAALVVGMSGLGLVGCAPTPDPLPDRSGHERFDRYYLHRSSPFQSRGDLFDRP